MPEFVAWARSLGAEERARALVFPVMLVDAPRALVDAADSTPKQIPSLRNPPRLTRGSKPAGDSRLVLPLARRGSDALGRVSIGRLGCEINLPFSSLSRIHAYLYPLGGDAWEIEDAGSTHGTLVNGRQLTRGERVALSDGTRITFAEIPVEFRTASSWRDRMLALLR